MSKKYKVFTVSGDTHGKLSIKEGVPVVFSPPQKKGKDGESYLQVSDLKLSLGAKEIRGNLVALGYERGPVTPIFSAESGSGQYDGVALLVTGAKVFCDRSQDRGQVVVRHGLIGNKSLGGTAGLILLSFGQPVASVVLRFGSPGASDYVARRFVLKGQDDFDHEEIGKPKKNRSRQGGDDFEATDQVDAAAERDAFGFSPFDPADDEDWGEDQGEEENDA